MRGFLGTVVSSGLMAPMACSSSTMSPTDGPLGTGGLSGAGGAAN
jgi:hypothetical protein